MHYSLRVLYIYSALSFGLVGSMFSKQNFIQVSHSLDFIGIIFNKNSYFKSINNFIKLIQTTLVTTLIVIMNKNLEVFING